MELWFLLRQHRATNMKLITTNQELEQALLDTAGDFAVHLEGEFSPIRLRQRFSLPVRIFAHRAFVKGLTIEGANIQWIGGYVEAPGGAYGFARAGYGISTSSSCEDISIESVKVRNADRGFVTGGGKRLTIANCDVAVRQDGIIASGGEDITFAYNWFHDFYPKPSVCTLQDGTAINGISSRDCVSRNGTWKDGDHSDAIQIRDGMKRVSIVGNRIDSISQGIGQMDATSDLPIDFITIIGNNVEVTGFHSITLGRSTNVVCIGNRTKQMTGRRSPLRLPPDSLVRDNEVLSP